MFFLPSPGSVSLQICVQYSLDFFIRYMACSWWGLHTTYLTISCTKESQLWSPESVMWTSGFVWPRLGNISEVDDTRLELNCLLKKEIIILKVKKKVYNWFYTKCLKFSSSKIWQVLLA